MEKARVACVFGSYNRREMLVGALRLFPFDHLEAPEGAFAVRAKVS